MSKKNKKPLVPKLRFPEFRGSGEWKSAKIGDFIESYKGGASLTPSDFINNLHYEVIPKKAITEGMWLKMDIKNPTCCKECFYKSNLQSVVDSDYLITTLRDLVPSGPNIGYIVKYIGNKKYILAQGVYGLKPKKTIISDYLIHFSNTEKYRRMMQSVMVGSTQVHIRNSVYLNLPLIIPSLPEQQKIADCLSSLDELITAEAQKIDTLKYHKKGLMQKLFPAEGETVPGLRFPEFRDAGGWDVKKLGECLDYIQPTKYLVKSTAYNDSYKTPVLTAGKTFVLGYTDESQDTFSNKLPVIIFDDFTTATKFVDFPFKAKSSAMKILLARKDTNIKFIFEAMQMIKYEVGVHARHWISKFAMLNIAIPSPLEQQKIADCLSSLDELITTEAQKLDTLKAHKKGLMQGLFPSADEVNI